MAMSFNAAPEITSCTDLWKRSPHYGHTPRSRAESGSLPDRLGVEREASDIPPDNR
jgi:hypothetical protein